MLGAIIGDIVGSRFEWNNRKTKEFSFFHPDCFPTDDSVMTLAVGRALTAYRRNHADLAQAAVRSMQELGRAYPDAGYGGRFEMWLYEEHPVPYNSFGNGAAMRVSGCVDAADSLEDAKKLSRIVTGVTHNHPEGLKGAEATVAAAYLARAGRSMREIRDFVTAHYYPLDFTLDVIRPGYEFDVTCQGSVPQALEAFFESTGFEDAVRNAVSIGGDSDTVAAITGAVAEAFYGIPDDLRQRSLPYLDERLRGLLLEFEAQFPVRKTAV